MCMNTSNTVLLADEVTRYLFTSSRNVRANLIDNLYGKDGVKFAEYILR